MATNKGGAPVGNQNAKNAHEWKAAMQHVSNTYAKGTIKKGLALRGIAEKLFDMALGGDMQAIKELGDRLDGRPVQAIIGEDGGPLQTEIKVSFKAAD